MRVLLVEDDRKLSAAVCRLLEKERITVDPVYDGNDGLDWAMGSEYDAIILDVMKKELRAIVWLGALLGCIMGTINALI